MMAKYKDELLCDLAEYYHIYDLKALPATKVALFACGLRENSRVVKAIKGNKPDFTTILLAKIADSTSYLAWAQTKEARKGGKPPKFITPMILGQDKEEDKQVNFESPEAFEAERKKLLESIKKG